jgi:hypothetical protein
VRRSNEKFRPVAALCYHSLARQDEKGSWLEVDVKGFERQIVALNKFSTVIRPMRQSEPSCIARVRINLLLPFDDDFDHNLNLG